MWKEKLSTLLSSRSRTQIISIALFLVGIVLVGGGLIYSLKSSSSSNDITFESGSSVQSVQTHENEPKITVDVEGAVISPGVYSLNSNSRVKDALIAAGGLASSADRVWVAKNLNLALKLSDSGKIYIPRIGENVSSNTQTQSSLVNINSATASELDSLPGIGAATAQKIIDNRPYSSIDDLRSKKVVSQSVFDKIKTKIGI